MNNRQRDQKVRVTANYESIIDHLSDAGYGCSIILHDELLKNRKILISNDINAITCNRIVSSLLYLNSIDSTSFIDLYIQTTGGWLDAAFSIISVIKDISAPVNTYALGGTHSSGAMILAAGTGTRKAYQNAIIMFHAGLYESDGEFGENTLDNKRIINFWERNAELPEDWLKQRKDENYYLDPEIAKTYKIIDEIISY